MLSIENPPVPDPSSHNENSSHNQFPHLDLIKSNSKFSIRDYVSSTRKKDIEKNWPFSQENLQLCLNHGVKDLLPPFQSFDDVRKNPSGLELNSELNIQTNHLVSLTSSDAKPVSDSLNIDPSGIAEDTVKNPSFTKIEARKTEKKGKKCKLILKLNSTSDQSLKEDNNKSETMASKVCPVCKTFTSSSNTTLNAHIDQCLSGESTIKWTANPKVIKNKIKPRRVKLMVDIYATAEHYTLEDLDRRNGTNWALGTSVPGQEIEQNSSPIGIEESENEKAVYVDANGTKVRILSKFDNVESSDNVEGHFRDKGDKVSTLLLSKKSKKHHKVTKIAPRIKKFSYPKMNDDQEEEDEALTQQVKAHEPVKRNESGIMGKWVSSKRSGFTKKIHDKNDPQDSKFLKKKEHVNEDNNQGFFLKKSDIRRGYVFKSKNLYSSPKTNMNNKSSDSHEEYSKELFMRKRDRVVSVSPSSSEPEDDYENEVYVKKKAKKSSIELKLRKNDSFDRNKINRECNSSVQKVEIKRGLVSKTKKFSLMKNHVSVPESKKTKLTFEKPRPRFVSESENESEENLSQVKARMEKGKMCVDRTRVSKVIKKHKGKNKILRKEQSVILKGSKSKSTLEYRESEEESPVKEVEIYEKNDMFIEPGSGDIGKSLDVQFVDIYNNDPFLGTQDLRCSIEPILSNEREIMFTNGDDENMNVNDDRTGNYYAEVDPIPIPGPPGSFLPSPGRTIEEFHGNSSLTSSQIQSSEDLQQLEFPYRDSSHSPSATSTISNSNVTKFDSRFFAKMNLVMPPHHVHNEMRLSGSDHPCCCTRKEGPVGLNLHDPPPHFSSGTQCLNKYQPLQIPNKGLGIYENDPISPSVSTPILRLMGKDLMVMKKDENMSPQPVIKVHENPQSYTNSGAYLSQSQVGPTYSNTQHFDGNFVPQRSPIMRVPPQNHEYCYFPQTMNRFDSERAKEIIVIDDANESGKSGFDNNFYGYQTNTSSSNINWNCVPKVTNLLPKSPFPSSSSSSGNHMSSTLYHSQGGFS